MKVKVIKYANEGQWENCVVTISLDHNFCFEGIDTKGSFKTGIFNQADEELEILTEADGVTPWKYSRGIDLGFNKCMSCYKGLCQCPQRQPDGSWKKEAIEKAPEEGAEFNPSMWRIGYYSTGDGTSPTPKKKGFMSNIVEKIKNLKLSATDRVLRKHGLEDENGKATEEAARMMKEELLDERWASRREAIAADLTKIDEEEKK